MARWLHRAKVVFIGIPIVLVLLAADVLFAAWDELTDDWRGLLLCLMDEWTIGAEDAERAALERSSRE